VTGNFDLDGKAKARVAELRHEMKSAAEEISKSGDLMRQAAHAGVAGQVKSLEGENQRELSKGKGFEMER
jgi:hypothetical protein